MDPIKRWLSTPLPRNLVSPSPEPHHQDAYTKAERVLERDASTELTEEPLNRLSSPTTLSSPGTSTSSDRGSSPGRVSSPDPTNMAEKSSTEDDAMNSDSELESDSELGSDSDSDAGLSPEVLWVKKMGTMERRHYWHFFYHGKTKEELTAMTDRPYHSNIVEKVTKEKEFCHWCQIFALNKRNEALKANESKKHYKMAMVYKRGNNLVVPESFKFIEENILTGDIKLAEPEFLSGCNCQDDFNCLGDTCHCLQDVDREDANFPEGAKRLNAYHIVGERKGCLRGWMLDSRYPIYECHDKCGCSNRCANRVVGRGRKVGLQVFPTEDGRGWGLRALEDIKCGQYVGSYVGEIITSNEAARRRLGTSFDRSKKDIYLFALDKFSDPNSSDPRLAGEPYEIDGEFCAGPTRFINHSCDPNLRIFAVVTDHANKPFHDLCFFALKEITRGTELTFDYTDGVKNGGKELSDLTDAENYNKTECLCGASNCRGYLW